MIKRDTRVQIIILENGKYILLKHNAIMEKRYFWGLPGGGREAGETDEEAAVREAEEETGLRVKLMPLKHEDKVLSPRSMYNRKVTFLASPVSGVAKLGYDPEDEMVRYFRLTDIKWQDFYDDDIDERTRRDIQYFRDIIASERFIKRAGALTYRIEKGSVQYLFVTANRSSSRLILPQGNIRQGEGPQEAAVRAAMEGAGAQIRPGKNIGFFVHESNGRLYKTDIYLAELLGQRKAFEDRQIRWIEAREIEDLDIHRDTRRFIEQIDEELSKYVK